MKKRKPGEYYRPWRDGITDVLKEANNNPQIKSLNNVQINRKKSLESLKHDFKSPIINNY